MWFGIWILYFHRMLNITYQVLEVDWPWTLSAKIGSHNDLSNLLPASIGDNGKFQNRWCLECSFPVRSTFPEHVTLKIQMIFTEFITTCPFSIHIKIITKILKLWCSTALWRRWHPPPPRKWRVKSVASMFLAATVGMSVAFSNHVPYQWKLFKGVDDVTFRLSLRHLFCPRLKKTMEHNLSTICIYTHLKHFAPTTIIFLYL